MSLDPTILNEGANAIRREAQKTRALLALADELESVSSIENAANEAQARLDALKAQEAEQAAAIAQRDRDALTHADGLVARAGEHAAGITQACNRQIAEAKAEADRIVEEGRAQSMRDLDAASGNIAEWVGRGEAAKAEHATVAAGVEALKAEHAEWNGKLAEVKAEHEQTIAAIDEAVAKLPKRKR